MSIKIDVDVMSLEIDGKIVATARRTGAWWEVNHWPRFFDRNQVITVLTVNELLPTDRDSYAPLVLALRRTCDEGEAHVDQHMVAAAMFDAIATVTS